MEYTSENRGVWQFKDRARQLINYNGLRFGNITPTDSDGEIEYHNKAWVFFEMKHNNAPVGRGQKTAFERKIHDISKGGKPAVFFIVDHYVDDVSEDIDAASCVVRELTIGHGWKKGDGRTLRQYIDGFLKWVDKDWLERG